MPAFWRTTYPQGRSGAECFAALFSTDRGCAGLGVEFWHLFTWAQVGAQQASGVGPDANTTSGPAHEDPLQRAQRLFLWDSGIWRGQGREALAVGFQEHFGANPVNACSNEVSWRCLGDTQNHSDAHS